MSVQIKLPVDVHLAVGDDRKMVLVVGGYLRPIDAADFVAVMSSAPLRNGRRKTAEKVVAEYRGGPRPKKGCRYCGKRVVKGKRLCAEHLAIAVRSARLARAAKTSASAKAAKQPRSAVS